MHMKRLNLLSFLLAFFLTVPAYASEVICEVLEKHVPDADVAYVPGVDVHGKAVAPADLDGGSQVRLPDIIEIPLGVDLASRLGMDYSSNELTAPLGTLEVYPDGSVLLNGRDVSGEAVALCAEESHGQAR